MKTAKFKPTLQKVGFRFAPRPDFVGPALKRELFQAGAFSFLTSKAYQPFFYRAILQLKTNFSEAKTCAGEK